MIVVNGQIRVIIDLNVCDLIIIDVIFVDLFADNEQPNKVFFLYHDFHLIQDELKFLSSVH